MEKLQSRMGTKHIPKDQLVSQAAFNVAVFSSCVSKSKNSLEPITKVIAIAPGDPTTPGYPSKPGCPRQSTNASTPSIPSIPISYLDALPLLKALNGYGP